MLKVLQDVLAAHHGALPVMVGFVSDNVNAGTGILTAVDEFGIVLVPDGGQRVFFPWASIHSVAPLE